jgi:hypothetical protein
MTTRRHCTSWSFIELRSKGSNSAFFESEEEEEEEEEGGAFRLVLR